MDRFYVGRYRSLASGAGGSARNDGEANVADDGQMVRNLARLGIGVAGHQRRARPQVNAVEMEQRARRREGAMVRVARQHPSQAAADRARPQPVVEVAQRHRGRAQVVQHLQQRDGLAVALAEAQPEMRGDHAQRPGRRLDVAADGPPRLALGERQVVDLGVGHRPAADQRLAVLAVGRRHGLGADAVIAERLLQDLERIVDMRLAGAARIDLLEGDDVGMMPLHQGDDALEVEARVAADARHGCSRS